MKIEVYTALDEVPAGRQTLAYIVHDGEIWPVRWSAATPEEARAKAQAFWDDRVEKERAAKPRGRPKKDQPELASDDVGDVI